MYEYSIFDFLESFSPVIPLAAILIARPPRNRLSILLFLYAVLYIPLSVYANYLATHKVNGQFVNNIKIYFLISIIVFCCFALVLENVIAIKNFRLINRIIMVLAVLFSIANAIWLEGNNFFNSASASVSSLICIIYCLIYYRRQLQKPEGVFIEKLPSFWAVTGIFLYSAGNFFLFACYRSLNAEKLDTLAVYMWYVNDVLILIMNIFFAKAIVCLRRK